jgi:surface protein
MLTVHIDLCRFLTLTFHCKIAANATGVDEKKYCMHNSSIKYVAMELSEYDETFSNMVYCLTAFFCWMYDSIWYKILHTKLLIQGTCNFFQQLKKNIIARWQIILWTNLSITYTCLILFVICGETCSMLMPGLFSDTFSKFVQLVLSVVILPMWCAVLNANHTPMYHNRGRGRRRGSIQCRGLGAMVRHCIWKIDFGFGKLITMLQKNATYVVLVNGIATCCGGDKWWVEEENPTTLKKMKLMVPMNRGIQRKGTRKKSYRAGFSPLLVLVGVLSMVGVMFVAVNGACTGSNPQICDPLPNGNGEYTAAKRPGSLGGVVDDFLQDYFDVGSTSLSNKPTNSMSTAQVIAKYGSIETWDTSQVNNMVGVFYEKKNINPDIGNWRVDTVLDMSGTFQYADSFNRDLSRWNVSRVTKMNGVFMKASKFNGDVSSWNVGAVTDMGRMFTGAVKFSSDIANWNVTAVTSMASMFQQTPFNHDLTKWDVSGVRSMGDMFKQALQFNGDVTEWNVGAVTDMSGMFMGTSEFNGDVSQWNVGAVINMYTSKCNTHLLLTADLSLSRSLCVFFFLFC